MAMAGQLEHAIGHSLRLPFARNGADDHPAHEHDAIVQAIAAGDAAASAEAMRAHLLSSARRSGIDLAAALTASMPHLALVFLTQAAAPDIGGRPASVPDSAAYLVKRSLGDPGTLLEALELVLSDGDPSGRFREDRERIDPLGRLSAAQRDTLRLIAEGLSNEEIAKQRSTSVRAVEAMVSRIFAVLDVAGDSRISPRVAATRIYAAHAGLPSVRTGE
jgi:DNA-binding NarL/FixJ family response regulator